jgi:hypothetical protein
LFDYLLTIPVNCNACMGKCHELYPCLKQVQHSFIEYKNYMYMFNVMVNFFNKPDIQVDAGRSLLNLLRLFR